MIYVHSIDKNVIYNNVLYNGEIYAKKFFKNVEFYWI